MKTKELIARLTHGEDNFVERKLQRVSPGEIRQTATAFANTLTQDETAILFIGVADDGAVVGVDDVDSIQKRVERACQTDCYPPISYSANVVKVANVAIVAVVFRESSLKPHFSGAAYVRRGSQSVKASSALLDALIASRNEKCGRIQQLKGQVISVIAHKRLGDTRRMPDGAYREYHECNIEDVDAHHVRLYDIGLSQYFSEPLSNVEIAYDEKRYRPMLIVRGGS